MTWTCDRFECFVMKKSPTLSCLSTRAVVFCSSIAWKWKSKPFVSEMLFKWCQLCSDCSSKLMVFFDNKIREHNLFEYKDNAVWIACGSISCLVKRFEQKS